MLKYIDRETSG